MAKIRINIETNYIFEFFYHEYKTTRASAATAADARE